MNTESYPNQKIEQAFDDLFASRSAEEVIEDEAALLMFRFLSIIETKRKKLRWTRRQLAEKIGTSPSYLTQLFRGDKLINMLTLAKFEKALNIDFEITEKRSHKKIN